MGSSPVRFLLRHAMGGVGVGLLAAALIIVLDVAQLRSLAFASSEGAVAIGLLGFGFAVTFGSVALGAAIMGLGRPAGPGRGGRRLRAMSARSAPLPVPVRAGR